jgi:glycosyltransferase involved in cell wall biosynthesis
MPKCPTFLSTPLSAYIWHQSSLKHRDVKVELTNYMSIVTKHATPTKVAFLVQLPKGVSPGQRFRCENWFPYLAKHQIQCDYFPFFDDHTCSILYRSGNGWKKIKGTLNGWWRRLVLLPKLKQYDFIFIQREAAPIGPPILEWFIAKRFKQKIIFDFDDAIWIPQQTNPLLAAMKCYWKVKYIIRWSYKVAAGNEYLAAYARQFNPNTLVLPTVVDTVLQHNQQKVHSDKAQPVVGWTGSHSTLKYLENLMPVLEKIHHQNPFQLLVIADRSPARPFPNMQFLPWKAATEIEDLLRMDIGIMPLEEDEWSEGKCGFKAIQYLALGIPAVASAIGVNKLIIQHGYSGMLCNNEEDWVASLSAYLLSPSLREETAKKGRQTIEKHYSIHSQLNSLLHLFDSH